MSGYYCRDCDAIKPLFSSSSDRGAPLDLPCLGTIPFDPELARNCDAGTAGEDLPGSPVRRALDDAAQRLLENLS
jgi:hypothetical protein